MRISQKAYNDDIKDKTKKLPSTLINFETV